MFEANNIALGVRGIVIAQAERVDGELVWGEPHPVMTAAQVAVALTKAPLNHRESGVDIINDTVVTGAKVTVQTANMPDAEKMLMYYGITAPQSGTRYLVGRASHKPIRLALGFYVKRQTGYACWWFLNGKAAPSDETYATETDQGPQIQTESIEFTFIRESDDEDIYHYEPALANQDAVDAFFESVTEDTPAKTIGAAVYDVTAPVKSATPQSTHDAGTGYTAAIAWAPTAETFAGSTAYKATVTLTAASGYLFAPGFCADDVQGLPASGYSAIAVTRASATSVTIAVTYAATGA